MARSIFAGKGGRFKGRGDGVQWSNPPRRSIVPENIYDQACRYLLRQCAIPLLAWLLRLPPGQLDFVEWLDTRALPWPGQSDRICA